MASETGPWAAPAPTTPWVWVQSRVPAVAEFGEGTPGTVTRLPGAAWRAREKRYLAFSFFSAVHVLDISHLHYVIHVNPSTP